MRVFRADGRSRRSSTRSWKNTSNIARFERAEIILARRLLLENISQGRRLTAIAPRPMIIL